MRYLPLLVLLLALPVRAQPDPLAWPSFEEAMAAGEASERKVLISVWASWCPWCRRLDREVYADPEVQAYLARHFEIGRIDFDSQEIIRYNGEEGTAQSLARALGAEGVPGTVFFDEEGAYLTILRGYQPKDEFLLALQYIATEAYEREPYPDFVERMTAEAPAVQ